MKLRHASDVPALEWLSDVSGRTARITSIGSRTLLVENHCGIERYASDEILLATRCGSIRIGGDGLQLSEVRRDAVIVRGSIRSVELPCEGSADHES